MEENREEGTHSHTQTCTHTHAHAHTHTQTCSAVLCMRLRVCLAFASKSSFSTIPLYDTPCESRNPLRSFTYYTCLVYQCTRLVCVCVRAHVCLLIVVCSKHASPSAVQCEPPQDPCMQHQCMYKCVCAHTQTCMHVSVYIYLCKYIYTHTNTRTHACMHACTHARMLTDILAISTLGIAA